jgi:hypothetical protein
MNIEYPSPTRKFFRHQIENFTFRLLGLGVTVALALAMIAACSSGPYMKPDPWMRQYLDPPDRVWQAIQISLDELEYTIESSNRPDGKIEAITSTDESEPPVGLLIDQVVWSEGEAKVYVKPADGNAESEAYQKAAKAFLDELDKQLKG